MKNLSISLLSLTVAALFSCSALVSCTEQPVERLADYVNPNIGTDHSRWFFYTPAAEPFGMAKLGASTNGSVGSPSGWEANGYEDRHTSIEGFPCFHEFQVGGVMLMPTVGKIITVPGSLDDPDGGYRSRFDKADEYATAGYYSVVLKDYGVKAELTATARVGFQRYTFPGSEQSNVIFDIGSWLGESGPVEDAWICVTPEGEGDEGVAVEGLVITEPTYVQAYQPGADVVMYFHAVVDKTPSVVSVFRRGGEAVQGNEIAGKGSCAALTFATEPNEQVEVKIGLSYTSLENARANLEAEAADKNFDAAREQTAAKWEEALGRIRVEGGTREARVKFYTGLYHALLGRGLAGDVNGAYPKNDGTVGQIALDADGKPQHNHYNTDAMWGGYWNLTQLWSLAYPEYYNDFVRSQMLIYRDAGWLGDGIAASKFVSGVGTNMMGIVFAGAYNSGIRDFDVEEVYAAALKNETAWQGRVKGAGKMDTKAFVERGYVPFADAVEWSTNPEWSTFGASHTLEYSFSTYAVAQWARALGKQDDYALLSDLSKGWERLFDPTTNLIRPRLENGDWAGNFNPLESWRGFQEGNAMQYTFFVPEDPVALVDKLGRDVFNSRLDSIFTVARRTVFGGGKVVDAFAGIESPYNHGNQPSLHISWLFNYSGKPWLTQKWTRAICDEFYGTDGEHGYGYGQDEDQGQLGAWYVMAAMGLFDVQGGTSAEPTFQIGSPQFERIEITLSPKNSTGKKFVITTSGAQTPGAVYVRSATLDGEPLNDNWFLRSALHDGGELHLEMGVEPDYEWGTGSTPYYSK